MQLSHRKAGASIAVTLRLTRVLRTLTGKTVADSNRNLIQAKMVLTIR